jgi:DNA-binding NtrC family response regulator
MPKIKALLVMARESRLLLLEALESCGIDVMPVCDCREARQALETQAQVQVVLTDAVLRDGDWRAVLAIAAQAPAKVEVIVCPRRGELRRWTGALKEGAYDLLVEPYQPDETLRIVEAAANQNYMRSLPPRRAGIQKAPVARAAGAA